MEQQFVLNAKPRTDMGKGASRRLRRTGKIPAILYGGNKEATSLELDHNELLKNLEHEAFYSRVLTVSINNQQEKAILKDLQRHPFRPAVLHVDLQRVSETEKITVHAPLHFINEDRCIGVKQGGGVISHHVIEVEIRCLPKDLPEFIEIDLANLNLNDVVHLSDLALPPGVELVALAHGGSEHDLSIVSVHLPRGGHAEEGMGSSGTEGQEQPQE
jgi:large subunit ribosomal protein L25